MCVAQTRPWRTNAWVRRRRRPERPWLTVEAATRRGHGGAARSGSATPCTVEEAIAQVAGGRRGWR